MLACRCTSLSPPASMHRVFSTAGSFQGLYRHECPLFDPPLGLQVQIARSRMVSSTTLCLMEDFLDFTCLMWCRFSYNDISRARLLGLVVEAIVVGQSGRRSSRWRMGVATAGGRGGRRRRRSKICTVIIGGFSIRKILLIIIMITAATTGFLLLLLLLPLQLQLLPLLLLFVLLSTSTRIIANRRCQFLLV